MYALGSNTCRMAEQHVYRRTSKYWIALGERTSVTGALGARRSACGLFFCWCYLPSVRKKFIFWWFNMSKIQYLPVLRYVCSNDNSEGKWLKGKCTFWQGANITCHTLCADIICFTQVMRRTFMLKLKVLNSLVTYAMDTVLSLIIQPSFSKFLTKLSFYFL